VSSGPALIAKAEMLIRRPVAEVFEAFVDPVVTSKFWFTKSSCRLEAGKRVQWVWEMYDVSTEVEVKEFEADARLMIDWLDNDGAPTTIEWVFTPFAADMTFVTITNRGFHGSEDEIVNQALDATEGFTLVLAGLKALLEHGIVLNLVADRFPAELQDH